MSGPIAFIGVDPPKPAGNPYLTNGGIGFAMGGLFGALKTSWHRVPTEDILSQKSFQPGHGANMMKLGLRWGIVLGGFGLVYTASQEFANAAVGEQSYMNKPVVGILTGLFLGARTASAKVFFKSSAIFTAMLFVMDQFPDLQTLQQDVRRDATAIRRARLDQYQREHGQQAETPVATHHHH